jgi:hypothetical protein
MFGRKEAKRKKSLIKEAMLANEWTPAERCRQGRVEGQPEDTSQRLEASNDV